MTIKHLPLLVVALIGSLTALAQTTKRIPLPASQNPSNSDLAISGAVWAGDTLYVSGWLDPDRKTHTDTTSQTVGLIKDIQEKGGHSGLWSALPPERIQQAYGCEQPQLAISVAKTE